MKDWFAKQTAQSKLSQALTAPTGDMKFGSARPDHTTRRDRHGEWDGAWCEVGQPPKGPQWVQGLVNGPGGPDGGKVRVLYDGQFFLTPRAISAWRPAPDDDKPVSVLLRSNDFAQPKPIQGLEVLELWEDEGQAVMSGARGAREFSEPRRHELLALVHLAKQELEVEVVRVLRPTDRASGVVSGQVLAKSEHYVAQGMGGNGVLVHEADRLSRSVRPGEHITVNMQGGRGVVYSGPLLDVNVKADFLTKAQKNELRSAMLDVLTSLEESELIIDDDERMQFALDAALRSMSNQYGDEALGLSEARIKLTLRELQAKAGEGNFSVDIRDTQTVRQVQAVAHETGVKIDLMERLGAGELSLQDHPQYR